MNKPTIPKNELEYLYNEQDMTDKEIADLYQLARTSVTKLRYKSKILSKSHYIRKKLLYQVKKFLTQKKINVIDLNNYSDFMINQKKVKVLFSSSIDIYKNSKFPLTEKQNSGLKESDNYILLKNGRIKPKYSGKSDLILFVQVVGNLKFNIWIMQSQFVDSLKIQTLSLNPISTSRYFKHLNAWKLLSDE